MNIVLLPFRIIKWVYLDLFTSKYTKLFRKAIYIDPMYNYYTWYKYSIRNGKIKGKIIKIIDENRVVFKPYEKQYRSLNSTYITDLYLDY